MSTPDSKTQIKSLISRRSVRAGLATGSALSIAATVLAATPAEAGAVGAGTTVNARVYLEGRDPAGMAAYARQVSDPRSPAYRHYLTPAQYETRFGPTAAQVSAVRSWLTGAGLHVTAVTQHYVAFSGASTSVHVPSSVASDVLTVTGLSADNARITPDIRRLKPSAAPADWPANCSHYYQQSPASGLPPAYGEQLYNVNCGYVPSQLRAGYGVTASGLTGKGETVAIVDLGASPTIEQDADTYARDHGEPPFRPGQLTQNVPADIGTSCQGYNDFTEESLDVEAAHAIAPDAHVTYVGADCTGEGLDIAVDTESRIVDGHLADIVSNSWSIGLERGMPSDSVAAFEQVFMQGAIEGIGFYFSSGDDGDWSGQSADHQPTVQYPAIDPWVTSVGGTSLQVDARSHYLFETGWGDDAAPLSADGKSWDGLPGSFVFGAGGGRSAVFSQPFYQVGSVPDGLSHAPGGGAAMRVMPDVAADADPATGMIIGQTEPGPGGAPGQYAESVTGGTSLAAPLVAGLQADAEQAQHGISIGFANPELYLRAKFGLFHDVTDNPLGPNTPVVVAYGSGADAQAVTLGTDETLHATTGYDDVTGVGSPSLRYLASFR